MGDGESVKVFKDPWLPMPRSFKTLSQSWFLDESQRVSDLIKEQQWQTKLIKGLFNPRDVDLILKIPLCPQKKEDRLVWHYTPTGNFSVSSAYRLGNEIKWSQQQPQSSDPLPATHQWKQLWALNVPPKMKHFGWRVSNNTLPCNDNIHKRMLSAGSYPLCNSAQETQLHALLFCDFVVCCWKSVMICPKEILHRGQSWTQIWDNLFKAAGEQYTNTVIMCLWAIWTARNKKVFQGTPAIIIQRALKYLEQFQLRQVSKNLIQKSRDTATQWQKPQ